MHRTWLIQALSARAWYHLHRRFFTPSTCAHLVVDSFQSCFDRASLMIAAEMSYTFSIDDCPMPQPQTHAGRTGRQCQSWCKGTRMWKIVALPRTSAGGEVGGTISVLIKLLKGLVDHVNWNRRIFSLLPKLPDKVVARHCWGRY
jgi:hypothetical protein